jgi:hypothetical protein
MRIARLLLQLVLLAVALLVGTSAAHAQITVQPETQLGRLDQLRGVHPRLFLEAAQVKRLQAGRAGAFSAEWSAMLDSAQEVAAMRPPAYKSDPTQQSEHAWKREHGNQLAILSFAWLLTRERIYLTQASAWARAIASQPVWGIDSKTGKPIETGLVYGHLLLGLSMFYDYAHDDMDAGTRVIVRDTLRSHAASAAGRLRQGTWGPGHALQSNHTWVYATGVMASGLALLDEEPAATGWIGLPLAILRASDEMLSPDGASQEGFGYHQYGVEYLLKLITLAEPLGFTEGKSRWWAHTGDYALAMLTPRRAWTKSASQVDFSDADRSPWYGPDHLLRWLARRNQDGVSQWLADSLVSAGVGEPVSPWLALLWKDPAVKPVSPEHTPTLRYFANMGIVSARSDWSGDEALVVFKSGNPIGDHAVRLHRERVHRGEYYHIHRDSNHFCLFGGGQWLIRNPGYGRWDTRFHNTLLVDGRGQKGDRDPAVPEEWPLTDESRFPRMVSVSSTPEVDRMVGDATAAYADDSGLRAYQRELIFIKPDVLVLVDRVTADRPRNLSILFLPETNPALQPDGSYLAKIANTRLRLDPLSIEGATVTLGVLPLKARNTRSPSELATWTLAKKASKWTSVTALSWSATSTSPRQVKLEGDGANALLRVGTQTVKVNLSPLSPDRTKTSL